MGSGRLHSDERALTEETGVAILVGMTILVTATVGLNVLVVSEQQQGPRDANFTYDYVEDADTLIITHSEGSEFPAGELHIVGPSAETTWAEAADTEEDEPVGPGAVVQVSNGNSYGQPVQSSDTIGIYHGTDENRTQLSEWNGA